MAALEKRGWQLVALESGLEGALSNLLKKAANPSLLKVEDQNLKPGELLPALQKMRAEKNADVALGIAFFLDEDEQIAELVLITPAGEKKRTISYGGHPKNALRWAPNIAINTLRRAALK